MPFFLNNREPLLGRESTISENLITQGSHLKMLDKGVILIYIFPEISIHPMH